MRSEIDLVYDFHRVFEHTTRDTPGLPDDARQLMFRVKMLREETQELEDALKAGDLVEVLNALTDIHYFLIGAYLEYGLWNHARAAFAEVHRSNMSKMGRDGKQIKNADGKTIKGPDFQKPNLRRVLGLSPAD